MGTQWRSKQMYEHPSRYQRYTCGMIELSKAGVYVLRVGGCRMPCPQGWAARIHKAEQDEVTMGRPLVGVENKAMAYDVLEKMHFKLKKKLAFLADDASNGEISVDTLIERLEELSR